MAGRIEELSDSVKQAGTVALDSTVGVTQGILVAAYPVILMATVALLTVALVRLPSMIFRGDE